MTDHSSTQLTRRQFLGATASVSAWFGIGAHLPASAQFAPAFFNCDQHFFEQLAPLLAAKPTVRVTLFLSIAELHAAQIKPNRQIDIGFQPSSADVDSDYAKWRMVLGKPLLASAEQGALWPRLATLCAREEIVLASWDRFSQDFEHGDRTPLFDGATVDLSELFAGVEKTGFLVGELGSAEKITPLYAGSADASSAYLRRTRRPRSKITTSPNHPQQHRS